MGEVIIETKQLCKKYGSFYALEDVHFHVKRGSIYGLIGDNGAGKSTLLKLLAGLTYSSSGDMVLLGKHTEVDLEQMRQKIGFLIEQPGYFPKMTVEQMLHYYCIQRGIVERNKIGELIQLVGLKKKAKSKCGSLSQGQKQRLGLAIALLGDPEILILDEPINGLDPTGIIELRALLKQLNEEKNVTIVLSSHILTELEYIATDYGFLSEGTLIEEISAQKLREKCAGCVEMHVTDVEKLAAILDKYFSSETFKILPNQIIRIYNPTKEPEVYSQIAAEHAIYVKNMHMLQTSLEDYYIELKKGVAGV